MAVPPRLIGLPQFEPISSFPPLEGFDGEAFPRWQMVPNGLFRHVFLDNAGMPGPPLGVRSIHPNIAEVTEIPSVPPIPRREFKITGKVSGPTLVQVFAPNGATVIGQLQVVVKNQERYKIAFHFVTDGLIEKTARPPTTGSDLVQELNTIFRLQANVEFDMPPPLSRVGQLSPYGPMMLKTTLPELAMEQREGRRLPQRGWDELDAVGDPSSHINVFFMKWHGTAARLPSQILEKQTNWIFEDGMPVDNVLIALAHRIGLFVGCPVTASDRHTHHLMHASRAEGVNGGPAGIHFIPRDCNNIINRSGVDGPGS